MPICIQDDTMLYRPHVAELVADEAVNTQGEELFRLCPGVDGPGENFQAGGVHQAHLVAVENCEPGVPGKGPHLEKHFQNTLVRPVIGDVGDGRRSVHGGNALENARIKA